MGMEIKGSLMSPASNGIMRDIHVKDSVQDFSDLRGRQRFEDSEVKGEGDGGFREEHFPPRERDRQMRIECLNGIRGYFEGSTGKRDIDFVVAVAMVFFEVVITAESDTIGEIFEGVHPGAAARANNFRFLFMDQFAGCELAITERIFTAEFLKFTFRILSIFPYRTITRRTRNFFRKI
jgi:hypothetical protein